MASLQTLNELFLEAVERRPTSRAVLHKREGSYRPVSSEDLRRRVSTFALRLGAQGIGGGDRFAILSENRLEWLVTDYAVLGLGAVNVPLYPTFPEGDIEYILRHSEAKGILVSTADQLAKVENIWPRLPHLNFLVVADKANSSNALVRDWWEMTESPAENAEDDWSRFRQQALLAQSSDLASIIYTSGTTGTPKGVLLTHGNIVSNVVANAARVPLGSPDLAMSFLPLCHIYERMLDYLYFMKGVTIAYAESFEALSANLLEVRPEVMAVVPRVFEKVYAKIQANLESAPLLKKKLFAWARAVGRQYYPHRLRPPEATGLKSPSLGLRFRWFFADRLVASKVRARLGGRLRLLFCGAAPLAPELADFFYSMGLVICEGYGLTETSPVIAVNHPGHIKVGTVGTILPDVEVKLDDAGSKNDSEGREILVRGPNVTSGYYRLEKENQEAFADGWFRTGDLGKIDAEGYLSITGRKKNLFKTSGGKYVAPEKLENLFQGHLYISQIMIIGDRRKFVSALIVPNFPGLEAWARSQGLKFSSRKDLVSHPGVVSFIEEQIEETTPMLAPFEKIRQFALLPNEFSVDSGELSPTQKIKRQAVEKNHQALIEEIYSRSRPAPS